MTAGRQTDIQTFLATTSWADAASANLAGDASNRRYLRLSRGATRMVLMDAPPDRGEDIRPFMAVTEWLREQGFSAPALHGDDPDKGFLLLEDLGDDLFARHLERTPQDEHDLYAAAVDLLVEIAKSPPAAFLQPYDGAVLDREARLFIDWWLPAASGRDMDDAVASEFSDLIAEATRTAGQCRDTVVLRDYHAENLIWLPERPGPARVGLLDYQDALAGHPAYDLMSLLEDARRDTSSELRQTMLARYLRARPGLDPAAFRAAYAALGAQRNLKIIGIFARLGLRDAKPRYLSLIPRVWDHLQRDLSHPDLQALQNWVGRNSPAPDTATLARVAAKCPS